VSGPLTYLGGTVQLVRRVDGGKVRIEYLQRGKPTGLFTTAWPHELTNHPDGLAGIKRAIATLADPDHPESPEARPRAFLHAQHAAGIDREDEEK
jgi:hypothetical protein